MTLDVALSVAYLGIASLLVTTMAGKRVFRSSPAFFAYVCFNLVSSAAALMIYHYCGFSLCYRLFYLFPIVIDSLLYFLVMVELGKNLLLFNRESSPLWQGAVWLFLFASVLIFALSRWVPIPGSSALSNAYFLCIRANEFLQFAGFLALIAWSSLRKLLWPDRELRVATGFGLSAFVWFIVSLLHSQWSSGPVYHRLDQVGGAANLVMLAYWLHYFWIEAGREAPAHNAEATSVDGPDQAGPKTRLGAAGAVCREISAHLPVKIESFESREKVG